MTDKQEQAAALFAEEWKGVATRRARANPSGWSSCTMYMAWSMPIYILREPGKAVEHQLHRRVYRRDSCAHQSEEPRQGLAQAYQAQLL